MEWKYKSGNTQLLGLVLENATQQPLATYFEEKIWKPLGMEYDASWNIDSKKHQTAKAFCCLNARARDYAKFARLYLKEGKWNGNQIVPRDWVQLTTSFTSNNSKYRYSHHWWRNITREDYHPSEEDSTRLVLKEAKAPYVDYQARGILGQFMYVNPEKEIIIIRLGDKFGKIQWASLFREIAEMN